MMARAGYSSALGDSDPKDNPDVHSRDSFRGGDFMGNEKVREHYDGLVSKGQALQQKQQMSMALTDEEIADFEQHRDAVLSNPVARGFLDAQQEMRQVQQSISQYVNKTLELGRLPSAEELSQSGCGHEGCGSCSC